MARLCERPGCSEPGAAAYGMAPEDLVFWLAPLGTSDESRNLLCSRHADSMVVPRGWTLDDRREDVPRLFAAGRFGSDQPDEAPPRRRRSSRHDAEQLQIDGTGELPRPDVADDDLEPADDLDPADDLEPADTGSGPTIGDQTGDHAAGDAPRDHEPATEPAAEPATEPATGMSAAGDAADGAAEDGVTAWTPEFDVDDDLGGLLDVGSPLLARAFRGTGRART